MRRTESLLPFQTITSSSQGSRQFLRRSLRGKPPALLLYAHVLFCEEQNAISAVHMRRTESLLPFQTTTSSSQGSRQLFADIIYVELAKNEKITKKSYKIF